MDCRLQKEVKKMNKELKDLLETGEAEKVRRGIVYTPAEIAEIVEQRSIDRLVGSGRTIARDGLGYPRDAIGVPRLKAWRQRSNNLTRM